MIIRVESEVGRLRRVLLHRPGREIDWMVPDMMEQLLFDDVLDGEEARLEHGGFRRVLEAAGVETLDPEELLAELLEPASDRDEILDELGIPAWLPEDGLRRLRDLDAAALAASVLEGVRTDDPERLRRRDFFDLRPLPNYFFQRDPQFLVGDRVMISSMATEARGREPRVAKVLFERHPKLQGYKHLIDLEAPDDPADYWVPGLANAKIEGGDVLVASPEVLLVGISERTNRRGVEALAEALRRGDSSFRRLIVVELPSKRAYMHLDTIFTFVDERLCLAHLPVIEPGRTQSAQVQTVDLAADELSFLVAPDVRTALASSGIEVELIPCGGSVDRLDQEREQWTDGANAFAVAPGVIFLYRRNRQTIEELDRRGFRVLDEEDALAGEPILGQGRTVVSILGNELSRARGGPRCMTMPLEREPLDSS